MEANPLRFYPGTGPTPAAGSGGVLPLARYLPPLPPGMAAAWLAENVAPGSWVLDPLGASPALALEAARAGYRVLVAVNNPVIRFLIETLGAAPKNADFQSALAELASSRRAAERLEVVLRDLYSSTCETCGEAVEVQAFLWRKGESQPYAQVYHCPRCADSNQGRGEHALGPADLERLATMGGDKMQRTRALQRVLMNEDDHRADVEEALESYLPRALYALFTLLNKAEGLGLPAERMRLLHALLLSAFDVGNTLWPYPVTRARPKQLLIPPQFRENNLWSAIEAAIGEWSNQPGPVPVTHWPILPPETGGVCLFRGRVKALMPLPPEISLRAVLTVFPRPNQAFWTLSVLWSGWLWGSDAALPLRNVLDRRRYDWNWHTSAIHSSLSAVGWNLPAGVPLFGLLPELAPGFLSAVMVAAEAGGFHLQGFACRGEQELAQGLWLPTGPLNGTTPEPASAADPAGEDLPAQQAAEWEPVVRAALREDLLARNEPAAYLTEYTAGLVALARAGAIPRRLSSVPGDLLTRLQASLARTFADRSFLKFYGMKGSGTRPASALPVPSADEERGWWWLADAPGLGELLPLADRVEMEVVRALQRRPSVAQDELDRALCEQFPGLLTPSGELVRACLESYGELAPGNDKRWRLSAGETSQARKNDLQEVRQTLEALGQRLGGFRTLEEGPALVWDNGNPAERWWFYRMASSLLSRYVLPGCPGARERCVIVLPGSRARLLSYKLRRDPRLAEAAQGWPLLKFRHLRQIGRVMLEQDAPSIAAWAAALAEDPLTEEATQMALFEG